MEKYYCEYVLSDNCQHDYPSLFESVRKFEKKLFLIDFEFLGRQGSDFNFAEYENLVSKNPSGLLLDWTIWNKIVKDTVQVVNLLIAKPLSNESDVNCQALKETTSFFIECIDAYNWAVFTEDREFFGELDSYFVKRQQRA